MRDLGPTTDILLTGSPWAIWEIRAALAKSLLSKTHSKGHLY